MKYFVLIFIFCNICVFGDTLQNDELRIKRSEYQAADKDCLLPKDVGNCTEKHERFYFDKEWKVCLAMKYSGCGGNNNNFMSRTDCEKCLHHDGSACTGPTESVPLVKTGKDCGSSVCPKSFKCVHNVFYNECCYALDLEFIEEAFSEKCPNGKKSKGIFRDYFQATFGKTCDDLICTDNQTCVQVNKEFAKCCEN